MAILVPAGFPELHVVLAQLAACIIIEDAAFYWVHRLLHHPKLYRHCHKVHHVQPRRRPPVPTRAA